MQIYLPIAEMSVNALMISGMGIMVGVLSGLFGVGGGFLMTPLLIFIGVPPAVAVGTQANQLVGASVTGFLSHWQKGNVDVKMGAYMLTGGTLGTGLGVWIFGVLQRLGQIDTVIAILYVVILGSISSLMLVDSLKMIFKKRTTAPQSGPKHTWLHGLPFKTRFPASKLYMSCLAPILIGLISGILVSIMGIGGGFLLVPAMIYILGMPGSVVAGTSLFQVIFTTGLAAFLQAWRNQTVDVMLAATLLFGGVIGAHLGSKLSGILPSTYARLLLALIVLAVTFKLFLELVTIPTNIYSLVLEAPK